MNLCLRTNLEDFMKRSRKKGKIGNCAYCGTYGPVTKDHVPPAGLFSVPKPSNLITVPACDRCHKPWSSDDEYFRIRLCLNDSARGHPDVNRNLPSVFKALQRSEAIGLRRALLADQRTVDVVTKGGVYLGQRIGFEIDMNRIARVVERIVRGLYYHERSHRLPDGYGVKIISNENLSEQMPEVIQEMQETIIQPLATIEPKIVGRNTFSYRNWVSPLDAGTSAWGLVFYSNIQFVALSGPNEKRDTV